MVAKLRSDVLINANPFSEVKNEKHKHNGYSDKVTLDINNKKYDVNFKDIENILMVMGHYLKNVHCGSLFSIFFPDRILNKLKA
ncbi:hypothetical protein EsCd1HHP049_04488 [Escherichia sp. HH154_1D]|nr:hypothetical protein EsCd1HHP049_04488 [Escherichia sp. HH154_1D]